MGGSRSDGSAKIISKVFINFVLVATVPSIDLPSCILSLIRFSVTTTYLEIKSHFMIQKARSEGRSLLSKAK